MCGGSHKHVTKPPTHTHTHTRTHTEGPGVWHPVECVFLRSSLKRWFSLISRSPWPTISLSFSHPALSLLLSRRPLATITSFISPLSLSLLCYLCIPPPCSFLPSIFVPLSLSLSVFISLSLHIPISFFYHPLSIRHRPRGRERLRGRRAPGCDATHRDCRWHQGRKPCMCPFASDQHNSDLLRFNHFLLLSVSLWGCFTFPLAFVRKTWVTTHSGLNISQYKLVHTEHVTKCPLVAWEYDYFVSFWLRTTMSSLCYKGHFVSFVMDKKKWIHFFGSQTNTPGYVICIGGYMTRVS